MGATVIQTVWDGHAAMKMCAGNYEALVIPSLGANVIALCYDDPAAGEHLDILRTPRKAQELLGNPYAYGIPVLFPANRIAGGRFTYDGVTYTFPQNYPNGVHIHGVLHNYSWPSVQASADELGATVICEATTDDPMLRSHFPIDLTFRLECRLTEKGLHQRFILQNRSGACMPFGLAYHTAFRVPFTRGGNAKDVRLCLPLEGVCLDDPVDRLPSGKVGPLSAYEAGFASPAGADPLAEPLDVLYKAQYAGGQAVLRDISTKREVVYEADPDDQFWIVWNSDQSDFVAVEPQTWLSNAVHLPDPAANGVLFARPHSSWQCETKIFVR